MNKNNYLSLFKGFRQTSFWLIGLALAAGFFLSILSWLELCTENCSASQNYRIFGMPFAPLGIIFFATAFILHFLSRRYPSLTTWVGWMLASAVGAELVFIGIQKYQIGRWCPLCLSIAACVIVASLILTLDYIRNLRISIQTHQLGETMQHLKTGLKSASFIIVGFFLSLVGISQVNVAEAASESIKERIVFGNKSSSIEVYFVSDWFCPSCKKIEPAIEKIWPKIQSQVAFYFIDFPIHRKSLNFAPYNLAFQVHEKPSYFKARNMLIALTEETDSPTDQDVMAAAEKINCVYKELSFSDVKAGMDYFDKFVDQYNLDSTPTIMVVNTKTNKTHKLQGSDEISEESVLKAIKTVKTN